MKNDQVYVLVAEDHPVNRKVMGLILSNLAVNHVFATNGIEAIEAATKGHGFSLILMDIMMPELDGFEAAREIRRREFELHRHTPIIACTASDKVTVKDRCIQSGIDDFLAKPVSRGMLNSKIQTWAKSTAEQRDTATGNELVPNPHEMGPPIDRDSLRVLYGIDQLDDILALFVAVTGTLLSQLESAIQHKHMQAIKQMCRELRGSSFAVSANEMAKLCLQLEAAAKHHDWTETDRLYSALALAFARVQEFLSAKKCA